MSSIRGSDPRISWHHDDEFGKVVPRGRPSGKSASGAIGTWGETVARNHLVKDGGLTVRHAVFRLVRYRLVCDLYDPLTKTAFEVKTRTGSKEPNFRQSIGPYRELLREKLSDHVVFVQVDFGSSNKISYPHWKEIREAGFQFLYISE